MRLLMYVMQKRYLSGWKKKKFLKFILSIIGDVVDQVVEFTPYVHKKHHALFVSIRLAQKPLFDEQKMKDQRSLLPISARQLFGAVSNPAEFQNDAIPLAVIDDD